MTDSVLVTRTELANAPAGRTIGRVTLHRPKQRNSLTRAMLKGLTAGLESLSNDPSVRVIVLTGANAEDGSPSFCAGADLRASWQDDPELFDKLDAYLDDFHGFIRAIWNAPKPVIARVDGGAVGFGSDAALAADLRILSDRAYFQESFAKIGLMPDGGGTGTLRAMVGLGRATELIFLATKIDAARAEALGLANRVVPHAELDAATDAIAAQLADGPPIALAEAKAALHASLGVTIDQILERERQGQLRCLRTSDCMEGVAAWMQKRPPQFTGQ
jgi:2-(1,2-epoxy-1,2-dihydrophenyl)acetyl-CoA isomerase